MRALTLPYSEKHAIHSALPVGMVYCEAVAVLDNDFVIFEEVVRHHEVNVGVPV